MILQHNLQMIGQLHFISVIEWVARVDHMGYTEIDK